MLAGLKARDAGTLPRAQHCILTHRLPINQGSKARNEGRAQGSGDQQQVSVDTEKCGSQIWSPLVRRVRW